jgi:hypothetical protein
MARQSLLVTDDPPTLQVVLDEAALHRLVSRRQLIREQLKRLIEAAAMPDVTLQLISFEAGPYGGMTGPFTILSFPDPADPPVVHLEHPTGDLYLDSADQVRRYRILFEDLQAVAATPDESITLLVEMAEALS